LRLARWLDPGYAFEGASENHLLRIFSAVLIDFRLRAPRVSKPLRSNVSRQEYRSFNALQGRRVPNSATAFDNRRRIVLKEKIPLS
jgi:hypothetical protein